MKKICLAILSMAFIAVAVAQEPVSPKPRFSGFVSNGLWDNWEISAGVGVGTAFSTGTNIGPKKERFGFEGNFSVAKWFHPVFGARIQLQGGKFNNFHPQYGKLGWPIYVCPCRRYGQSFQLDCRLQGRSYLLRCTVCRHGLYDLQLYIGQSRR